MKTAEAFAPAHITGLFQICEQAKTQSTGSKGAGVSMERGVQTKVVVRRSSGSSVEIWINGERMDPGQARVSETVTNELLSKDEEEHAVRVEHNVQVPIGSGFGSSGASALGLALALNEALNLGFTRIEAAQIAHTAEVLCGTGLGTVAAETFGGLEMRVKPGAPGVGKIQHIPVSDDYTVACLSLGPLSTQSILADSRLRERINEWGERLLQDLIKAPSLESFLELSRSFAEHTGLITKRVKRIMDETDASTVVCSMPMFGEGLFSVVEAEDLKRLLSIFRKHGASNTIITGRVDHEGARLL